MICFGIFVLRFDSLLNSFLTCNCPTAIFVVHKIITRAKRVLLIFKIKSVLLILVNKYNLEYFYAKLFKKSLIFFNNISNLGKSKLRLIVKDKLFSITQTTVSFLNQKIFNKISIINIFIIVCFMTSIFLSLFKEKASLIYTLPLRVLCLLIKYISVNLHYDKIFTTLIVISI